MSYFTTGNISGGAALLLSAVLLVGAPAHAQQPYRPVVAQFSGQSSLSYPPTLALEINDSGTIEFWVAAQWQADPGYDPAILAYSGASGPRFAVHIGADRKSLGVFAGAYYAAVPYDFSDGALHYVALVTIADTIEVHIDGALQAVLGFGFASVPVSAFTVGSIGGYSPFIGQIGQIRIWNLPLDDDVLAAYELQAVVNNGASPHPQIEALVAMSAFANPETGGFVFFGASGPFNISEEPVPVDDSDLPPP